MKSDILPDLEDEPLAVTTLFPDPEYFTEWSKAQEEKKSKIKRAFDENPNPDIVCITHTDADGYGCEVLLREAFPDKNVLVVTAAESGPLALKHVGEYVTENMESNETPLYITDLAPNPGDGRVFIDPFRNLKDVTVIDHHEWEEKDKEQVEWVADLIHDTGRCATQIVHDELVENPREEITALSDLTADHDLWLKENRERSDALSALAHHADRELYVELCRTHGDEVVDSEEGQRLIEEAEEIRDRKTELAVSRASFHDVNGYTVAITYGQCDPSDAGEALYSGEGADLACIIFPSGRVSFRSSDETPIAREVAVALGGGGHECAAGAKVDMVGNGINYETHWATKGRGTKEHLLEVMGQTL